MKNLIYSFLLCFPFLISSCNDDDVVVDAPSATGTVIDDKGNTYGWVRVGNLDWTTSNARNGLPATEFKYYNNFDWVTIYSTRYDSEQIQWMLNEYIPEYGNLMCMEEAIASAPEGWRVPTDEDWKNLERAIGISDVDKIGWRGEGVVSHLTDVDSGLGLGFQYAGGAMRRLNLGYVNISFDNLKEYGYYWSSTASSSNSDQPMAYFRKIVYGQTGVERQHAHTGCLMSVRWCRDAQTN